MMQYTQDFDEALPPKAWTPGLAPYLKVLPDSTAVFACPARPKLTVGYAMNTQLVGHKLSDFPGFAVYYKGAELRDRNPDAMALLFESNLGGANPVGGPQDVPEKGVHDGTVGVARAFSAATVDTMVGYIKPSNGQLGFLSVPAAKERLSKKP